MIKLRAYYDDQSAHIGYNYTTNIGTILVETLLCSTIS